MERLIERQVSKRAPNAANRGSARHDPRPKLSFWNRNHWWLQTVGYFAHNCWKLFDGVAAVALVRVDDRKYRGMRGVPIALYRGDNLIGRLRDGGGGVHLIEAECPVVRHFRKDQCEIVRRPGRVIQARSLVIA